MCTLQVDDIFESVRRQALRSVEGVSWLSPHMKAASVDKLSRVKGDFGGADIYFNATLMRERYGEVRTHAR